MTCNKNEGNRIAIPVLTGEEAFTLTGQDRHGVAIDVKVNGYNATLNEGGYDTNSTCIECERLQRIERKQSDDDGCLFAIDKGIEPEEREVANCIEARENRGLSKRKQEGTLICMKI